MRVCTVCLCRLNNAETVDIAAMAISVVIVLVMLIVVADKIHPEVCPYGVTDGSVFIDSVWKVHGSHATDSIILTVKAACMIRDTYGLNRVLTICKN